MAVKTDKKVINYQSAKIIADRLQNSLKRYCVDDKCVIAGSIRRKENFVGDIEIVCIPRYGKATPQGEIFPRENMNLLIHHLKSNNIDDSRGYKIIKGGPRYHQIIFAGMQCDIFMTTPKQFGRMLALRTGPETFSIKMASRWKELGYKGVNGELISIYDTAFKPEFPTEQDFFEYMGWKYIEPENRG